MTIDDEDDGSGGDGCGNGGEDCLGLVVLFFYSGNGRSLDLFFL